MKVPKHMLTEEGFAKLRERFEHRDHLYLDAPRDMRACIVTIETMSKQIRKLNAEAKTRKRSKPIE